MATRQASLTVAKMWLNSRRGLVATDRNVPEWPKRSMSALEPSSKAHMSHAAVPTMKTLRFGAPVVQQSSARTMGGALGSVCSGRASGVHAVRAPSPPCASSCQTLMQPSPPPVMTLLRTGGT